MCHWPIPKSAIVGELCSSPQGAVFVCSKNPKSENSVFSAHFTNTPPTPTSLMSLSRDTRFTLARRAHPADQSLWRLAIGSSSRWPSEQSLAGVGGAAKPLQSDRKSTRLNSSHL